MTDKLRELLEDVRTVYEGKGMVVHPNSFDKLRMEVIKLDNISRFQNEQIEKMKSDIKDLAEQADKNGDMLALKRMSELFKKWG